MSLELWKGNLKSSLCFRSPRAVFEGNTWRQNLQLRSKKGHVRLILEEKLHKESRLDTDVQTIRRRHRKARPHLQFHLLLDMN